MRFFIASALLALGLSNTALAACPKCESFGIDFQNGGSYFQNVNLDVPWTAFEEFENCQHDNATNVLVLPSGDQYECNMVPLQPALTKRLVTCPVDQPQLQSGEYSLLVLSNNGNNNCAPLANQRNFYLTVGQPFSKTVNPTVTISSVTTPIVQTITTVTSTLISTAAPQTVTSPSATIDQTYTSVPFPTVTVVTSAVFTVTSYVQEANIVKTQVAVVSPSCSIATGHLVSDGSATIQPTFASLKHFVPNSKRDAAAEALPTGDFNSDSSAFSRALLDARDPKPAEKAAFLRDRRAALRLAKRHPDPRTTTVTNTNLPPSTTTKTSTAPTHTVTGTTTSLATTTTTSTITVLSGVSDSVTTITEPQVTITNTFYIPVTTVTVTETQNVDLVITSTAATAATAQAAACTSAGGKLMI